MISLDLGLPVWLAIGKLSRRSEGGREKGGHIYFSAHPWLKVTAAFKVASPHDSPLRFSNYSLPLPFRFEVVTVLLLINPDYYTILVSFFYNLSAVSLIVHLLNPPEMIVNWMHHHFSLRDLTDKNDMAEDLKTFSLVSCIKIVSVIQFNSSSFLLGHVRWGKEKKKRTGILLQWYLSLLLVNYISLFNTNSLLQTPLYTGLLVVQKCERDLPWLHL